MKKIILFQFTLMLINTMCGAQEDATQGIYIDGTFVDKMECLSFDNMDVVFPIPPKEKYEKYDVLDVRLTGYSQYSKMTFQIEFTPTTLFDNFGDAKYGVWKFYKKGGYTPKSLGGVPYSMKSLAEYSLNQWKFEFIAAKITGTDYNGNPTYAPGIYLCEPKTIEVNLPKKYKYHDEDACLVSGQKVAVKIEKSLAFIEGLGLIKDPGKNSGSSIGNAVITSSSDNTSNNTSGNKTTTTVPVSGVLKPLDKTKPGYFVEKSGNEIDREGYKKGDALNGEVRVYTEGKIREVSFYVNDKRNGTSTYYFDNGRIEMTGNMKDDEKDGEWKFYDEAGKLKETKKYMNGEEQD